MRAMFLALAILVAGCAAQTPPLSELRTNGAVYHLGPGDRLKITVFGEDNMSGEYSVTGEGDLSFPLVGRIPASGLTLPEFETALLKRLDADYLRGARVTVEVAAFRPVFILGEVERPGEFPFAEGLSIYALVAKAGGFTYRANTKVIFVRHEKDTEERPYRLNSGAMVQPGDTVRISHSIF